MTAACDFCEHRCNPAEGRNGRCTVRGRRQGVMETLNWGQALTPALDPIEKKPFYHFRPGSTTLSLALGGCNFHCEFCQNYRISQPEFLANLNTAPLRPEQLPGLMEQTNTRIVAYTYSEPTVWQDWMLDCARQVRQVGGENLMVTNGFFTTESWTRLEPWIDGFNLDLKGGPDFYRQICGGRQDPILRNIATLAHHPTIILEVTTLYIAAVHSPDEILALGHQLAEAGVRVWHLSRFFPAWKMDRTPATTEAELFSLLDRLRREVAIPYIYEGNTSRDRLHRPVQGAQPDHPTYGRF